MFGHAVRRATADPREGRRHLAVVAAERRLDYDASEQPTGGTEAVAVHLDEALDRLEAAVDAVAGAHTDALTDRALLTATERLEVLRRRLDAGSSRVLRQVDVRGAYTEDAAATAAAWLRQRLRVDPGEATARVRAARRLEFLDQVRAAWEAGHISTRHVEVVARAAIPQRRAAIEAAEATLVALSRAALPVDVRRAVARIRDIADPDGTATPHATIDECRPDPRRELNVAPTIDGLADVNGTLAQLTAEMLFTLIDAYDVPDDPSTPEDQRRTPGQRRHDAFTRALETALRFAGDLPDRQGHRPHIVAYADVNTLLGRDEQAVHSPRLAFTGECDPALVRHLTLDAAITPVLTMGPFKPVAVGRKHRVAPGWMRRAAHGIHPTCIGPGCDRPANWTQMAHLETPWAAGGTTDLETNAPVCSSHHHLIDDIGWQVTIDTDRGTVTWTSPDEAVVIETAIPP